MSNYQFGVIGGGNMTEAILRGVVTGGFLAPRRIVVSEPLADRRKTLSDQFYVAAVEDNTVPAACPYLLLAVKPQILPDVLDGIAPTVGPNALVISIAAGIRTDLLDEKLAGRGRIVRVMPNTPMLVGEGAAAVCAGPRATDEDVVWTRELLTAGGGLALPVEQEQMDAVTAVSGSGPAYFFFLVEAMVQAGVAEGLSPEVALSLARQTCLGAGKLLVEGGEDPAELRRRVTSPNGTTQRAVETLESDGVREALIRAVRAAAERSRELGG